MPLPPRWLANRIPPPILAVVVGLLMAWLAQYGNTLAIGPAIKYTLVGCFILVGLALEATGLWIFFRGKTTINPLTPEASQTLMCSGVYRLTRNPMYLGLTCQLFAWACYLAVPSTLFGVGFYIALITWLQILPEEQALGRLFGQRYLSYCAQVRRWI